MQSGDARYLANDTRLHVDPPSRVIHRAPSVDSAKDVGRVSAGFSGKRATERIYAPE